jgi:hypothetical protein
MAQQPLTTSSSRTLPGSVFASHIKDVAKSTVVASGTTLYLGALAGACTSLPVYDRCVFASFPTIQCAACPCLPQQTHGFLHSECS